LPVSFHHALLKVSIKERGFHRPLQVLLPGAWLFRSEAAQPDQKCGPSHRKFIAGAVN